MRSHEWASTTEELRSFGADAQRRSHVTHIGAIYEASHPKTSPPLTGDVDAVAAEDVEGIHRQVLAGQIQEAHVEVDLELFLWGFRRCGRARVIG